MNLRIVSDGVLGSKVESPRNIRGEEGGKNERTTEEGGSKHGYSKENAREADSCIYGDPFPSPRR